MVPRLMCDVWWPAVGPFLYIDAFCNFFIALLVLVVVQIFTNVWLKKAVSSPTISPNLSRNAGSFFSFELLKSMDTYRLQVINCRSQMTQR